MHQIPFLDDLLIVILSGVAVTVLLSRLRLPMVAGLLLAGALVGPSGFGLVRDSKNIETLSEVGVGLLLFSVGLEFSLRRLLKVLKVSALGGVLQVGLTVLAVALVTYYVGEPLTRGVFFGFVVAMSSTAIVMSFLSAKQELDAPHGRFIVGILIFQDLCVVPVLLLIPALAGQGKHNLAMELLRASGLALAVVLATLGLARVILPRFFAWVDATRMREIFLLAVLGVVIGIAWLTSYLGLSLALGAFLAGVVLADSDFGNRAMADVLPLRSTFTSIFFISLGMIVNPRLVLSRPLELGLLVAAFILGKWLVASLAALVMRFPSRVAWLAGAGLAQFGEFGFVLAVLGQSVGLMGHRELELFLTAGGFSMFVTPIAMSLAPHFAAGEKILQPLEHLLGVQGIDEPAPEHKNLSGHIVIAGYGVAGKLLASALARSGIPYLVLEMNAETVRTARSLGIPIYYGDIASREAMAYAGVERSRALVLMINDPAASRRALTAVHSFAPHVTIFIRSRYLSHQIELRSLGADEVVSEELVSAMEMLGRVLHHAGVPDSEITRCVDAARLAEAKA
ncbi:MAG: cation:proton antiporter [Pseudomonadota bacterium]